jgi:hypothetical protein
VDQFAVFFLGGWGGGIHICNPDYDARLLFLSEFNMKPFKKRNIILNTVVSVLKNYI